MEQKPVRLVDILPLIWDIVELNLSVREEPMGRLIRRYHIGPGCNEESLSYSEYHDVKAGKLVVMDIKINAHGDRLKNGHAETAWGVELKRIPEEFLGMQVDHMTIGTGSNGVTIYADLSVPVGGQMRMEVER